MDTRIIVLEQRVKEQWEEMSKELEALTKANKALTRENEPLRAEAVTPKTRLLCNVIPLGFADPALAPAKYGMEIEAVNLSKMRASPRG